MNFYFNPTYLPTEGNSIISIRTANFLHPGNHSFTADRQPDRHSRQTDVCLLCLSVLIFRHTDNGQTDRDIGRHIYKQVDRQKTDRHSQTYRLAGIYSGTQTRTQTYTQMDNKQTDKQADRRRQDGQIHRQADAQTNGHSQPAD